MTTTRIRELLSKALAVGAWHPIDNDIRAMYSHYHHRMALASNDTHAKLICALVNNAEAMLNVIEQAKRVLGNDYADPYELNQLEQALQKLEGRE